MSYFVRKVSECQKLSLDSSKTFRALVDRGDPVAIQTAQKLFTNPKVQIHRLVGPEDTEGRYAVNHVRFEGGEDFPDHVHDRAYALIYVLEGKGYALIDGTKHPVETGDVIFLPPGTAHGIFADEGAVSYLACLSPDLGQDGKSDIRFL
jgi:quercetin dioxygenase-like cupin family protein